MASAIFGLRARKAARVLLGRREAQRSQTRVVCLQADEVWSAWMRRGAQIYCAQGAVWVTQTDEARDIVLHERGEFTARRDGLVVAQAIGDEPACFRVSARPRRGGMRVQLSISPFLTWFGSGFGRNGSFGQGK